MKRNQKLTLTLIALAALTFGSGTAWAHWNDGYGMGPQAYGMGSQGYGMGPQAYGMGPQDYSQLTNEQQATVQKLYNDFYTQTGALRQQLLSKRYEYNALLTSDKPDSAKIESVSQEMETLGQQLAQQRAKFDVALAQAGISRGEGMASSGGCYGGFHGHRGMYNW